MINKQLSAVSIIQETLHSKVLDLKKLSDLYNNKSEKDKERNNQILTKYIKISEFFLSLELKYDLFSYFNLYNVNAITQELNENEEALKFVYSLSDAISVKMAIGGLEIDHLIDETVKGVMFTRQFGNKTYMSEQMLLTVQLNQELVIQLCSQNVWLLILYLIKVHGFENVFHS